MDSTCRWSGSRGIAKNWRDGTGFCRPRGWLNCRTERLLPVIVLFTCFYREVPYRSMAPMRRSQIHNRIAARGVVIYGDRGSEIAAELAMHFEQSHDWPRALEYLLLSAENAAVRSAHHEAISLASRGMEALQTPSRSFCRACKARNEIAQDLERLANGNQRDSRRRRWRESMHGGALSSGATGLRRSCSTCCGH